MLKDLVQKKTSQEDKGRQFFIGATPAKILAVNPTEEELKELGFNTAIEYTQDRKVDFKVTEGTNDWTVCEKRKKGFETLKSRAEDRGVEFGEVEYTEDYPTMEVIRVCYVIEAAGEKFLKFYEWTMEDARFPSWKPSERKMDGQGYYAVVGSNRYDEEVHTYPYPQDVKMLSKNNRFNPGNFLDLLRLIKNIGKYSISMKTENGEQVEIYDKRFDLVASLGGEDFLYGRNTTEMLKSYHDLLDSPELKSEVSNKAWFVFGLWFVKENPVQSIANTSYACSLEGKKIKPILVKGSHLGTNKNKQNFLLDDPNRKFKKATVEDIQTHLALYENQNTYKSSGSKPNDTTNSGGGIDMSDLSI